MTHDPLIFDRHRVMLHRKRALRLRRSDTLQEELVERLTERLQEMNQRFSLALQLGAQGAALARSLQQAGAIDTLVQCDVFPASMAREEHIVVLADEECIPFADNSFDLCISFCSMHWINDLPGTLIQIRRLLKPGGLFLAMLPGGQTLKELRESFEKAEIDMRGGLSPRISPFVDVRDAGSLLQRAGFSDPVTDSELLTLQYEHPLKLLKDLRAAGQTNALLTSFKGFTPCSLMMLMADHYLRHFSNAEGRINATLELVTLTAWKSG